MIRIYSQLHSTDKYSEDSWIIWLNWPNGWVFVYNLSGSGFKSSCCHINFTLLACFEQRVPWHSGNYRVWTHSETRRWLDKNKQSIAPYKQVLRPQLNYLFGLAKWFSVHLRAKWFWVQVQFQSPKLHIRRLFQTRSSLTFRELERVDSRWKA